jgi:serine/threonine protein kinase
VPVITEVGKYKVLKEIGRGGMGAVFLGLHPSLNRKVAIKMLTKDLVGNKEFIQRFEREAKIIATLDHPNIVQVYDYEEALGTYFIIMEFIEGKMLSEMSEKDKPMPHVQVAAIFTQIANALSFAHNKGIVHRDIKPGNVMIRPDGVVKLMDFGIAFSETTDVHLTQEGKVIGTPKYMSPEQLQGKKIDARSDIYSLGVMCYEMLAGKPPFDGSDFITIATKHLRENPVPIRQIAPEVTQELENFIEKALVKDREQRLPELGNVKLMQGESGDHTIYLAAARKKGISRWFFYLTILLMVIITALVVFNEQQKRKEKIEKDFKARVEKSVKDVIDQSSRFYAEGKFQKALEYLQKMPVLSAEDEVLKKSMESVRKQIVVKLEEQANALYSEGKYADAIVIWKQIFLNDKSRKEIEEKIVQAQAIIDSKDNSLRAEEHYIKGDDLQVSGDLEGAEKEVLAAQQLDPKNVKYLYTLGYLNISQYEAAKDKTKAAEELKKAIGYFEGALKIDPKHEASLKDLSYAYLYDKQKDKAIECARRLIAVNKSVGEMTLGTIESY